DLSQSLFHPCKGNFTNKPLSTSGADCIQSIIWANFDTSVLPICKDSVGWIFTRLDINRDLFLDQLELASVGLGHPGPGRGAAALDKYERCLAPFLRACDTYADGLLSNNEWCFCFQRQKPPCHVQRDQLEAEKRLMGYVPSCDADGFYQAQQCHQGTDQCWCVDPNGKEQPGSRVYGQADCGWDEAEGSGNEGSGDADDWTDDDDIAKGTAQAQVVGSKVEEAEPEDADDEDEDMEVYMSEQPL
uniref:Thyroglobulin type-1 domain-containing protein n=1 Tax=Eptatretus burgeri TaxID=7764 RepID=A0A8C4NHA7_EPTBU